MTNHLLFPIVLALSVLAVADSVIAADSDLDALRDRFEQYSGARLVFDRAELPSGQYYDVLQPLSAAMKAEAAVICLDEVRKYPPNYFAEVGLKAVGVFAACVSKTGDGFRAYDSRLKGYRYYGIYNGADAIAAAYYDDPQLEMTFHHEIFHHIDSTDRGQTASWQLSSDDAVFYAAVSGLEPYASPGITAVDVTALRGSGRGRVLRGAVSPYAARNSREDQAETARHLMRNLPDSLVQAIDRPELPGSQRILHVLREYEQAVPDGPGIDWFVDVSLKRTPKAVTPLLNRLQAYADGGRGAGGESVADDPEGVRRTLQAVGRLDAAAIPPQKAAKLVRLASELTQSLLRERIRPDPKQQRFTVFGPEDAAGVNWTLRKDVQQFEVDAIRLKRIAAYDTGQSDLPAQAQMRNLRLIARYYAYIASNWNVTPGTRQVFESARETLAGSLAVEHSSLTKTLQSTDLLELARRMTEDDDLRLLPKPVSHQP